MMCTRIIECLDRYLGSLGGLCGFMTRYQANENHCAENGAYCERARRRDQSEHNIPETMHIGNVSLDHVNIVGICHVVVDLVIEIFRHFYEFVIPVKSALSVDYDQTVVHVHDENRAIIGDGIFMHELLGILLRRLRPIVDIPRNVIGCQDHDLTVFFIGFQRKLLCELLLLRIREEVGVVVQNSCLVRDRHVEDGPVIGSIRT